MPTHRLTRVSTAALTLTALTVVPLVALGGPAAARTVNDSGPAVRHDTSAPLRTLPPAADPRAGTQTQRWDHRDDGMPQHPTSAGPDGALQVAPATAATTTSPTGFSGVGNGFTGPQGTYSVNSAPPDPNLAVGDTQVVQVVNEAFAVFDKSTHSVSYGPVNTNTVWSGFGGGCQSNNDGDAVVRYDAGANRWVLVQFSVSTSPYLMCVAVSQTHDATGRWNRYAFTFSNFPDYPKLGIWGDSYYTTYNLFSGNTFVGAEACAWNRSDMLAGNATSQVCRTTSSAYGGLLPSDQDGPTAPPAGEANMLVALGQTGTTLAYWDFGQAWTSGTTTFTGPVEFSVASYNLACGGGTCIPQAGTSNQLDSLGDRLMYRLAYRNLPDHQSWLVAHSVTAGSAVGVRWYELTRASGATSGTPTVHQQGTYAPSDGKFRWMPSIAQDASGDMAVGYSVSSSSTYPSIAFTGRTSGDALNTMSQAESILANGTGSQVSYPWQALHRWGDYTSMALDPTDDCTFWYTDEYIPSNGQFNWVTWISSFKFSGCSTAPSAPAAPTGLTATALSTTRVDLSWTASTGATSYDVYRSTDGTNFGPLSSTSATSVSDTSVTAGNTYWYYVEAVNSIGRSAPSNTVTATTAAPLPPTGVTATAVSASEVDLSWNASSGASGYYVLRSSDNGVNYTQLNTAPTAATSYRDTSVTANTSYLYEVEATNSVGTSAPSSPAAGVTTPGVPVTPTLLTATPGKTNVKLTWTSSSGATSYKVYYSRSSGGPYVNSGSVSGTSATVTGLKRHTTYWFEVTAVSSGGESAPSNTLSATTT